MEISWRLRFIHKSKQVQKFFEVNSTGIIIAVVVVNGRVRLNPSPKTWDYYCWCPNCMLINARPIILGTNCMIETKFAKFKGHPEFPSTVTHRSAVTNVSPVSILGEQAEKLLSHLER